MPELYVMMFWSTYFINSAIITPTLEIGGCWYNKEFEFEFIDLNRYFEIVLDLGYH